MLTMSRRTKTPSKLKTIGNHDEFLNRISKSLYYSKLPVTECLSLPVTELAAELFNEVKGGYTLERLDVEEASRISRNACVSPCSLVLALLYLERLKDCNPEYLQQVAPSELFLVTLMVASKFLNDEGEDDEVFNTEWALSADLTVLQINQLEKDFLKAIDWTVFVHNQEFWERLQKLEKDVAYREAQKRNWFSYTELTCLMNSTQLTAIAQVVVNISTICLATYTAGVITLLGSALVASYLPGTVLSPRQINNSTDMKTDCNPVMDVTSLPIEIESISSEDILIDDFIYTSLSCNQSQENYEYITINETIDANWKWWLNSMMIWLPEYSGLESTKTLRTANDKTEYADTSVTTKFLFDITMSDEPFIKFWKHILGFDLEILLHDWRYYTNCVTKLTLDHQH
ncbi:protein CNPPD1 [Bombus pascuorum]|uniref:protein CNPPD1 n=1 Tax=Bombus pascuorum TaxID=65598 RepID=UPI00213CA838|nr:protein CNPPD1 [Bombus pascuorum]